jgi:hypothetical protein
MKTQIVCAGLLLTARLRRAVKGLHEPRSDPEAGDSVDPDGDSRGVARARDAPVPPAAGGAAGRPTVVILPDTPLFAPFEPTRPLSEPWSMTTYLGRGVGHGYGHGQAGPAGPAHVQPGIHLVYGRR